MPRAQAGRISTPVWLASLALALTSCVTQQDGSDVRSATSGASVAIDADWSRLSDRGYVYFQANTDGKKHYELFRADLASGQIEQITRLPGPFGISNFSVSPAGLIVSDASSLSDQAKWLRSDGTLVRLPGPQVLGPELNERGDVLASIATGQSETLAILRHGARRWEHVRQVSGWPATVWIDNDAAAVISTGRRRTTWSLLTADGRRGRERAISEGPYVPGYVSHYRQPIIMSARRGDTGLLWQPGQRPRILPVGWEYGCVSPDGARLLLRSHGRLGVLDVADLDGPVREIGTFNTPIIGCGWVDERFGA